ncbi:sugar kinase [Halobacillus litoralis]|uniref:Sugar kinase n=1 Tax=Halobacillus litoralis TaxID=45668 RepID=A0A845E0V5_9BACI|nr:sugar kinase [Halobacillus litoralis]MYL49274.1 sugar kinase [Halobacillus litoralis]
MSKIITLGEPLMRMTPPGFQRVKETKEFKATIGGAELNASVNLANLGHEVAFVSALPGNDLGENVRNFLRERHIDDQWVKREEGRLGVYYVEEGYGPRSAKVTYDRAYSSFLQVASQEWDWEAIFDSCQLFHVSGITPALSPSLKELTLKAVKEARERNVLVSFDCNYRSKLWSEVEAKLAFEQILPYVDVCFAGQKDFTNIMNEGPEESFHPQLLEKYFRKAALEYGISLFACTNREVRDSQNHQLQGFLFKNDQLFESQKHSIQVLDRIGGGDSFAAGILHGMVEDLNETSVLDFGMASSILKHTVKGDHSSFSEDEVFGFMNAHLHDVVR